MKRVTVCIEEVSRVYYTVDVDSDEEAVALFEKCPEKIEEEINRDLERGYQGREIRAMPAAPNASVDFTREELKGDE